VVQRLVLRTGVHRIDPCGHRLDALARQRQHQARAVALQAGVPIGVSKALRQMIHLLVKPLGSAHRFSPSL